MESKFTRPQNQQLENEWIIAILYEKYLFIEYKKIQSLDLKAAHTIVADCLNLTENKIYPVLTNITNMPSHPKEVRDYFAGQASASAIANGILVNNPFSKLLANLFLSLNKPIIPTKIFTTRKKAVEWLDKYYK